MLHITWHEIIYINYHVQYMLLYNTLHEYKHLYIYIPVYFTWLNSRNCFSTVYKHSHVRTDLSVCLYVRTISAPLSKHPWEIKRQEFEQQLFIIKLYYGCNITSLYIEANNCYIVQGFIYIQFIFTKYK